ncbi:MAG: intradiol ring-cleavage dioxygenase [Proteobacteria bacterium]|nr:intradiol ring-cleavage dioxygenase [Pseudomonadota bacterium]
MRDDQVWGIHRRHLLAGAGAGLTLAALPLRADTALTPACGDRAAVTASQGEGPYFTPDSPLKGDFTGDTAPGEVLVLQGFVLDASCRPVAGAVVGLWHADRRGRYDNSGFSLRGHQYTDEAGRYRFETCTPGDYPGRARHYHVKVRAPKGPLLTTQLYFPDDPGRLRDFGYKPALELALDGGNGRRTGRFDFVVRG